MSSNKKSKSIASKTKKQVKFASSEHSVSKVPARSFTSILAKRENIFDNLDDDDDEIASSSSSPVSSERPTITPSPLTDDFDEMTDEVYHEMELKANYLVLTRDCPINGKDCDMTCASCKKQLWALQTEIEDLARDLVRKHRGLTNKHSKFYDEPMVIPVTDPAAEVADFNIGRTLALVRVTEINGVKETKVLHLFDTATGFEDAVLVMQADDYLDQLECGKNHVQLYTQVKAEFDKPVSKSQTKEKMAKMNDMIKDYNMCFASWYFLEVKEDRYAVGDSIDIPFVKNDKGLNVNDISANMIQTDEMDEKQVYIFRDNADSHHMLVGLIPYILGSFVGNSHYMSKAADSPLIGIGFSKTIARDFKRCGPGYRLRFITKHTKQSPVDRNTTDRVKDFIKTEVIPEAMNYFGVGLYDENGKGRMEAYRRAVI